MIEYRSGLAVPFGLRKNYLMRQISMFTTAEIAGMRDRTASRNHSPSRDEFRRRHEHHRAWGLVRRHAERLRLRQAGSSSSGPRRPDPGHRDGQTTDAPAPVRSERVPTSSPSPSARPKPQKAPLTPQKAPAKPREARPTPQQAQRTTQEVQLTPQQAQLTTQQAQLTTQQAQLTTQRAQLTPQQSRLTPLELHAHSFGSQSTLLGTVAVLQEERRMRQEIGVRSVSDAARSNKSETSYRRPGSDGRGEPARPRRVADAARPQQCLPLQRRLARRLRRLGVRRCLGLPAQPLVVDPRLRTDTHMSAAGRDRRTLHSAYFDELIRISDFGLPP
ncbi:hypothetical protein ACWKSP_12695 [Micromonosporaceae bacterium Da 78-11]